MNERSARRGLGVLCFAAALFAGMTRAQADEAIGVATAVRPELNQVQGSREAPVTSGESVSRAEVLKTGPSGSANIVFTDKTNMSIGPSSRVALTDFVFAGQKNYEKATFQLAKGAFRFATGNSDKHAYEINTPTASLAVRGTVFEVKVVDDKTTVNVESGEVEVCTLKVGRKKRNSSDEPKRTSCNLETPNEPAQHWRSRGCSCVSVSAGGSTTVAEDDVGMPGGDNLSPEPPPGAAPTPLPIAPHHHCDDGNRNPSCN